MARAPSPYQYPSQMYPPAPRRRPSLLGDIYNGAVRGDFARELRLPGALTQMVLGYVPGIGTLCAARDLLADLGQRDRLGAALNFLALFPVLGGFPKTAAVIQHVHLIGRAIRRTRSNSDEQAYPAAAAPSRAVPQAWERPGDTQPLRR